MEFVQISDRVNVEAAAPMDVGTLPGSWINSNPDTNGIARIEVSNHGQVVADLRIGPNGLIGGEQLPSMSLPPLIKSRVAAEPVYDFGFAETWLRG
jgi:hypothetical protein